MVHVSLRSEYSSSHVLLMYYVAGMDMFHSSPSKRFDNVIRNG